MLINASPRSNPPLPIKPSLLAQPMRAALLGAALLAAPFFVPGSLPAQAPAPAASAVPHGSGTVKTVEGNAFVVTTAAGADVSVAVPAGATVLLVQPGSRDLKNAQPGTVADVAAGDRIIVNGSAGDTSASLNATRVIVMKGSAIAATRASDEAAWAQGVGGIVRAVDPATGAITLANGMRTLTINTTPATSVKRYAGGSVRFEDAVPSTLAAIRPGDQIRVRGPKNPDGTTVTADAIVAGSFSNFSGRLTAVDASAGTVTLKDLATKRTVTVAVSPASNVRRMPAGGAGGMGGHEAGSGAGNGAASRPAETGAAGDRAPASKTSAGTGAGGSGAQGGALAGGGSRGGDLSRIVNRLPTETLSGLKTGDAVMIVASDSSAGQPTAITLLAGVDAILAAHPGGETTLSPWNIGGGEGAGEGGEGGSR